MQSCKPWRIIMAAMPMDMAPEAQAEETVWLMPLRRKMQARFMEMVELRHWKSEPLPQATLSCTWRNLSTAETLASTAESLP